MAKKVSSEAIRVRLWQFDKLAGVVGTGSGRVDHRRAHPQSRGVTSPVAVDECLALAPVVLADPEAVGVRDAWGPKKEGLSRRPTRRQATHLAGTISAFLSRLSRFQAPLRVIGVELLI
jgi:hypothetical protein